MDVLCPAYTMLSTLPLESKHFASGKRGNSTPQHWQERFNAHPPTLPNKSIGASYIRLLNKTALEPPSPHQCRDVALNPGRIATPRKDRPSPPRSLLLPIVCLQAHLQHRRKVRDAHPGARDAARGSDGTAAAQQGRRGEEVEGLEALLRAHGHERG